MADPPPGDPISQAIQRLEQRQQAGELVPLTPAAYDRTRELIADYITDLVNESERAARDGASTRSCQKQTSSRPVAV